MPQIPTRTPSRTTKAIAKVGRTSNPKHIEMYAKRMDLTLCGANPAQIQAVAAQIHKTIADHELVIGGKTKRKVTISCHPGEPFKVFDGTVSPDSVR